MVLYCVRKFIACTPNLLVVSFCGMDYLTIPMQMTHSCIMTMDHDYWRDGLACIELCVSEIRVWMNQNMLKRMMTSQSSLCLP